MIVRILFCLLLLSLKADAEHRLHDGQLIVADTAWCRYETSGEEYKSYIFSNSNEQQLVFVDAMELATVKNPFVTRYYRISFTEMGEEVCVSAYPYLIDYLCDDLIKFEVIKDGRINENGVVKLVKKWRRKQQFIPDEEIKSGVVRYTNIKQVPDTIAMPLSFREGIINYKDSAIGSYSLDHNADYKSGGRPMPGRNHYFFYDRNKKYIAKMVVNQKRGQSYLWIGEAKEALTLITPEKDPERMLRVATIILMQDGKLN